MVEDLLKTGAAELGLCLDEARLASFAGFSRELDKWNRKINLTAIEGVENVSVKHFLDSLTVPAMVSLKGKLLDMGSGAGFPGIPIKIMLPELQVVSVDAVEKKVIFQRHVARLLGLRDFTALHTRGESLAVNYAGAFDFIVSRAFSDIIKYVKMVLPLLAEGGCMIAMKGTEGRRECEAVRGELAGMGVAITGVNEFRLPLTGDGRTIVLMNKN